MSSEGLPMYIGCGCLVHDGAGRYLLVQETKEVADGLMALPAGKLEPDETLTEAAAREACEETGLDVEVTSLVGIFHCPRTVEDSFGVNFVFAAVPVGGVLRTSIEHPRVDWLTRDEIERLDDAGGIRGAHVVLAIRRFESGDLLDAKTVTLVAASRFRA